MIKRILLVLLLLGLSGCTLPDYIPPADSGTNAGTPAITPGPTLTQIIDAPTSLPTVPGEVTETLPVDENVPQATSIPATPQGEPTSQPQVIPTPYIYTRYLLQSGSPAWAENFVHPEAGCNWMGLGGQVFNLEGIAVPNLVVKLTGTLNGEVVDLFALTGGALNLGPGGYEFKLSDHPISSTESLWVSIFDKDGNEISNRVAISTYESCDKNFVVVNFTEAYLIENGIKTFLPFISLDLYP
jgi:hypothetical protein